MKITYGIRGVKCNSCIEKLEPLLQKVADQTEFTLSPATVALTNPLPLAELNTLIKQAGDYELFVLSDKNNRSWLMTYYPLVLIAGYITLVSGITGFSIDGMNGHVWMKNFMAGFFLVFSGFKLLDLRGFANAYASYDVLAKRWYPYGFIYPFLELALGLSYVANTLPTLTALFTFLLMSFSSIGVIQALRQKKQFQCACLGTVLNLPMTKITLFEDVLMAVMALLMLV